MPIYEFQHPKTKKTIELKQSMLDKHEYIDDDGVKWDRVWDKNVEVGVVHQRLVEGNRQITNIGGKSVPKDQVKTRNANFKYQYSCRETPETT